MNNWFYRNKIIKAAAAVRKEGREEMFSQTGPLCWSPVEYRTTPEVENTSYSCVCACVRACVRVFNYFHVRVNLK